MPDLRGKCGGGSPLDWACCGIAYVADDNDEQDSLESESRRAESHKNKKAGNFTTNPHPPIVFSSADSLTVTSTLSRSISRSMTKSTFSNEKEDEVFAVIADLLGSSKLAANAALYSDRIVEATLEEYRRRKKDAQSDSPNSLRKHSIIDELLQELPAGQAKADGSVTKSFGSHDKTKPGNTNTSPHPPIVFSSADTLPVARTLSRSIARSLADSTFFDDDEDELYYGIAALLGNSKLAADAAILGDQIVLSMGYKGENASIGHKSDTKASKSSASKSTAPSSSHESPTPTKDDAGDITIVHSATKDDAGDITIARSAGQSHIPHWVGGDEKIEEPVIVVQVEETKTTTMENKSLRKSVKTFLCKWSKKRTTKAPPSDVSNASSAFSSLGFCTILGE